MDPSGVSGHQEEKYLLTQCKISHPALSWVPLLPFDWSIRNLPQEPKVQHTLNWAPSLPTQTDFFAPLILSSTQTTSQTSSSGIPRTVYDFGITPSPPTSTSIWCLLTPSLICHLNPPSSFILCTNAFNNLTISHWDSCITLLTHCLLPRSSVSSVFTYRSQSHHSRFKQAWLFPSPESMPNPFAACQS